MGIDYDELAYDVAKALEEAQDDAFDVDMELRARRNSPDVEHLSADVSVTVLGRDLISSVVQRFFDRKADEALR